MAQMPLPRARQIVAHPDRHPDCEVLEACESLTSRGDWIDFCRAKELRKALEREARAGRRDRHPQWARRILELMVVAWLLFCALAFLFSLLTL